MLEVYNTGSFFILSEVLPFVPYYLFKSIVFFYNYSMLSNNIIPVTSFLASWVICDEFFFTSVFPKVFDMSVFPEASYHGISKAYSKLFTLFGNHEGVCVHITKNMELFYDRRFDTQYVRDAFSQGGRHINRYPDVFVVVRLIDENMIGEYSQQVYSFQSVVLDSNGKRVHGGLGPYNPFQYPHRGRTYRLPNSTIDYNYLPYEMHFKHLCFLLGSFFLLGIGICFYGPDIFKTAFHILNNTLYYIFSRFH